MKPNNRPLLVGAITFVVVFTIMLLTSSRPAEPQTPDGWEGFPDGTTNTCASVTELLVLAKQRNAVPETVELDGHTVLKYTNGLTGAESFWVYHPLFNLWCLIDRSPNV